MSVGVSFSTVAIAWALHHASAVIVGCPRSTGSATQEQHPDQLDSALSALDLVLDDDDLALLGIDTQSAHVSTVLLRCRPLCPFPVCAVVKCTTAHVHDKCCSCRFFVTDRPPSQQLTGQATTASQPGVYTDERDSSHPIGATMAPWRDTAHLGPSAEDEAKERARVDADSPFVRDELAALGLPAISQRETLNPLARLDTNGVGQNWGGLAAELQRAESSDQLAKLAMEAVDRLAASLEPVRR